MSKLSSELSSTNLRIILGNPLFGTFGECRRFDHGLKIHRFRQGTVSGLDSVFSPAIVPSHLEFSVGSPQLQPQIRKGGPDRTWFNLRPESA